MSRTQFTLSALLLASAAVVASPTLAQDRHPGGDDRGNRGGAVHDGRGDGADHAGGRTHEEQPAPAQAPVRQAPAIQPRQAPPQAQSRQQAPQPRPQFQPRQGAQNQAPNDRGNYDRANGGGGWQQRGGDPRDNAGRHVQGRDTNGVQVWRNDDRGQAQRQEWQNNDRDHARSGGWDQNRQAGGDRDRHDGWNGNGRPGSAYANQGGWNHNDHARGGNWNSGWRNDRRYDWQGWRNSHRDNYRVGQYRVPYGYHGGYHRWGIGVRIDPIFFGQDYWIDNPDYYRLPPAYDDYRWVRYYNDALLIDVYSGTVVDEIPDFFW